MVRSALILCLVSGLAFGQEAPRRAWQVQEGQGELVLFPHWVYTPEGKGRVDSALLAKDQRIAEQDARIEALEKQPAVTLKGVLIFGGAVFVAGVVAGFALKR